MSSRRPPLGNKKHLLHPKVDVKVEAYKVNLLPVKVEILSVEIKRNIGITRDLSNIPTPFVYKYTRMDASSFEKRRMIVPETGDEDDALLTDDLFETLRPTEVGDYVFQELKLPPKQEGVINIDLRGFGFQPFRGGQLNPVLLALPSLYPESSFNFQGLLKFPQGKTLLPFQRDGVTFLIEREKALLADEMGLGKSIQAITAARLLFRAGVIQRCLVICPKSVLIDWANKFQEWAPELKTTTIRGSAASRRGLWYRRSRVSLVTYDTLKEDVPDLEEDEDYSLSFDLVILDEIQRIKNRSTQTFRAVNKVGGKRRWGLSGTPLENRVEDLTTIFSYLTPDLFRSFDVDSPYYVKAAIKPFTLRRVKKAVLKDLPKKTHDKILLELGVRQRGAYNRAERTGVIALKEKGKTATVTHVMALISKLKQICNLEPVSGESCKLEYVEDVLGNLFETGEKMIVFSQYPEKTLKLIKPRLGRFHPLIYSGSLTSKQRDAVLQRFEEDADARVLLISLKAGGLGLTLTMANYVVHFDSWWNPATMSQAEDRTHRIGQKKNVFIASLITRDTVEERIQRILEDKRALFKEVMEEISDEGLTRLLTEKELFGLFGLQRAKKHVVSHADA